MQLKNLWMLSGLIVLNCFLGSAYGQDAQNSNQLEKRLETLRMDGSVISVDLEMLKTKHKVLVQLTDSLNKQKAQLEQEYLNRHNETYLAASRSNETDLPTTSLEINSQLMGNCLTELQRLKWEAASAAAEIEEAQAEAEEPTDGQLQLQKVRSAIELAETDLRSNQEVLDNMGRQRDAAAVSATEYAKQAALVERLQVQLEALLSELKVMKELQAATTRLPLQAAKKRLAEVKSREKVVQQQLKQLQTQEEKLRKTALMERVMDRLLHQSLQIEQQQLPFQIQLHENQVLLKLFEDELQKRQGAEAAKANAQEVNSKED